MQAAARYALSAALLSLTQPSVAHASDDDAIDTVTIIGRTIDVADVPGSAHVIDSEQLLQMNQTDILRVLRSVPGVYVQEEEGFGLRPNIGIRGSGLDRSARIALLEDGVLIAPAPYAAASAYYFPTQRRMNSIEVLKGPASVAIGPRTTGGALNMISTPIPEQFGLNLDVRTGNHETLDAHLNVGNRGERVSWMVETVQADSDGFKNLDASDGGTGFDLQDYVAKLQLDSDPLSPVYQSLRFKYGYTEQVSDETYMGLTSADFEADPYRRYAASAEDVFTSEHEQVQLSYVIDPGGLWLGRITAYNNDFKRNWYKVQSVGGESLSDILSDPQGFASQYATITGQTSADDAVQIRANNRAYFSRGLQARLEWQLGLGDADIQLNTGFRVHEDEEDRFQHQDGYRMQDGQLVLTTAAAGGSNTNRVSAAEVLALFIDTEIRAGNWILTPGVRYEDIEMTRHDYSTADPGRGLGPARTRQNTAQVFIPGMGALYRVNEHWRLLAGLHKGYNPPSPGSNAEEETSVNIEAGTRFSHGRFEAEAIYFRNDYDNLVGTVTESTGGNGTVGDQFDGGEVTVSGIEFSATLESGIGRVAVPLSLRYTWTGEAEFNSAFDSGFDPWGNVQVGDELPYIPEHQLQLSAGLHAERWRINLAANHVATMRSKAGQGSLSAAETIASHTVWDLHARWQFTNHFSSYIKIDNVFDEVYVAARRPAGLRPGLPRTAYVGFSYRL